MKEKQHIPAGYKSSPLGIIPKDWEVKRLGEVCDIDKHSLSSNTNPNYEFDYISLSDVDSESFEITTTRQVFKSAPSRARRIVSKGDVIISTVRPNLQAFSLIKDDVNDLIVSTGFAVLTPQKINGEYLYQYVFSQPITKQFYQLVVGSNYPAVNSSDVFHLKIAVPPLPEQQRIVSVLSLWDTAISKQTALIEKLTIRKRGLMQQLLTGKKRLKGFEGEWKEVRLGEIATFFSGGTPKSSNKSYYNGDIPFIRSGEIDKNKTELFISQEGINNSSAKIVEKGDILYALYGATSGQCSMSKIRGAINQAILCIKPNANRYFIMSVLQLNKENYYNSYLQGGQGNLSGEIVSNYIIPIPTNEEQNVIASILIQADKEIELADEKLTRLQEQKKGLMQVLLTGKKRVK